MEIVLIIVDLHICQVRVHWFDFLERAVEAFVAVPGGLRPGHAL